MGYPVGPHLYTGEQGPYSCQRGRRRRAESRRSAVCSRFLRRSRAFCGRDRLSGGVRPYPEGRGERDQYGAVRPLPQ